jgi:hypothetical protein
MDGYVMHLSGMEVTDPFMINKTIVTYYIY